MLSHARKTVFVHIPKCGGQSVEEAFLTDLGLTWKTRKPLVLMANADPRLGPPRLAHLTAREYVSLKWMTQDAFEEYHSFAIVRDPVARAISLYNYLNLDFSIDHFIDRWLVRQFAVAKRYSRKDHNYPRAFHFVRPQSDFLCDEDGTQLVDQLVELERLSEHESELRRATGLASPILHRNKSVSKFKRSKLTAEQETKIRSFYSSDYEILNYS